MLRPRHHTLTRPHQRLEHSGVVHVAVIPRCEEIGGVAQQVGEFLVAGLILDGGDGSQRSSEGDIAQGVGHALGELCLYALVLGHLSLAFCHGGGFKGFLLRGDGVALGLDSVESFPFAAQPHLVGHTGLLEGFFTLLVGDLSLLVGDLLHLGTHTAVDGRAELLLMHGSQLLLEVFHLLPLLLPSHEACRRQSGQQQSRTSRYDRPFLQSLFSANSVISSLCSASPTKAFTSAFTLSTIS